MSVFPLCFFWLENEGTLIFYFKPRHNFRLYLYALAALPKARITLGLWNSIDDYMSAMIAIYELQNVQPLKAWKARFDQLDKE